MAPMIYSTVLSVLYGIIGAAHARQVYSMRGCRTLVSRSFPVMHSRLPMIVVCLSCGSKTFPATFQHTSVVPRSRLLWRGFFCYQKIRGELHSFLSARKLRRPAKDRVRANSTERAHFQSAVALQTSFVRLTKGIL